MDFRERAAELIAWWLPRKVVYFCGIRIIAHATTGVYGGQLVQELTAMEALKRWEEK